MPTGPSYAGSPVQALHLQYIAQDIHDELARIPVLVGNDDPAPLQHYSGDRSEVFGFGATCIDPLNSEIWR